MVHDASPLGDALDLPGRRAHRASSTPARELLFGQNNLMFSKNPPLATQH